MSRHSGLTTSSSDALFDKRVKRCLRAITLLEGSRQPSKEIRKLRRLLNPVSLVIIVSDGFDKISGRPVTNYLLGDDEWHAHVQVDKATNMVVFSRPYGISLRRPIVSESTSPELQPESDRNRRNRTCVRRHRRQIRYALNQYPRQCNTIRS